MLPKPTCPWVVGVCMTFFFHHVFSKDMFSKRRGGESSFGTQKEIWWSRPLSYLDYNTSQELKFLENQSLDGCLPFVGLEWFHSESDSKLSMALSPPWFYKRRWIYYDKNPKNIREIITSMEPPKKHVYLWVWIKMQ